jgi:hypothetical protein
MSSSELSTPAATPSEESERLEEKREKVTEEVKPGRMEEMIRGSEGREKRESQRNGGLSPFYTSFFFFSRPTEKDVSWERLLFARSHHRSWDELTPHHPATQHEKKLPA